jgi:hypothetical protein
VEVVTVTASGVIRFVIKEFREALVPIAYFFITFNLVELTTQLILADYFQRLTNYMIATTTALVVGKAVLVADALPIIRRFDAAPMIKTVLFKTVFYWAVVFIARLLEGIIEYWIDTGSFGGAMDRIWTSFSWHRFAAIQIWIFVLFLVYTFVAELNVRLGKGVLRRIIFSAPAKGARAVAE